MYLSPKTARARVQTDIFKVGAQARNIYLLINQLANPIEKLHDLELK